MHIPVIDLADALTSGGKASQAVASKLRSASMATGFFYIKNHGIPAALVAKQFQLTQQLMDLPLATRQALSVKHSKTMRGFEELGEQRLDAAARPDLKESFYCGLAYAPDHPYGTQPFDGWRDTFVPTLHDWRTPQRDVPQKL